MSTLHILTSVALLAVASVPLFAQNVPESCGVRDWFQLRNKVAQGGSSVLCKGAMDAAFEHRSEAEHELKKVIQEAPRSNDALAAHHVLWALYFRHGQYRKALSQVDQSLLERPDDKDLKDHRAMLAVLAHFPDLEIAHGGRSVVEGEINDYGLLCIPLTIHGLSATYILDTGASISMMSESEAKRLGLAVQETTTRVSDANGTQTPIRLAEAPDLRIGRMHLKNVAFGVSPDGNVPFVGLPNGQKAILGISVLLALGSLRTESTTDNRIVVGARQSTPSEQSIPLAFDNMSPLVQIRFQERPLTFGLDTGANRTSLYKSFADAFPSLIETGHHKQEEGLGFSSTSHQDSIEVPTIRLSLTPRVEMDLTPATVLLNTDSGGLKQWAAGTFGLDMLIWLSQKYAPLNIDFHAMRLSFP
jgi:hypothetical protein